MSTSRQHWARSRAKALERDLLVAYPVINIHGITYMLVARGTDMRTHSSFCFGQTSHASC